MEKPKEPEFQSSIERKRLRRMIKLGEAAVEFTSDNTSLFTFSQEYEQFNHVYRKKDKDEGGGGTYYFVPEFKEVFAELDEAGFPLNRAMYPSIGDEKVYVNWQDKRLENELKKFGDGGDLPWIE